VVSNALPFSLFGNRLKSSLVETLRADSAADGRHASIFKNEEALAALLERVSAVAKSAEEQDQLAHAIESAWNELGGALPEDATPLKHGYLKASLRSLLVAKLGRNVADVENIRSIGARIDQAEQENETLARSIAEHEKRESDATVKQEKLKVISADLDDLNKEVSKNNEILHALEINISSAKDNLQILFGEHASDRTSQSLIEAALAAAMKIENVVAAVRPDCFAKIGLAVTKTYTSLAHKRLVSEVEIAADGTVTLYDVSGRNIRSLEASAGENQIFSMALMAAIGDIMPIRVPIIMDTPLGRLDRDHRERLLTFFAHRDVQTIMLSQPDEVNGIYLEMIEDRVATRFLLDHQGSSKGLGATVAREGYFNEAAA
jgi:DNA sulfur modification protein DndD